MLESPLYKTCSIFIKPTYVPLSILNNFRITYHTQSTVSPMQVVAGLHCLWDNDRKEVHMFTTSVCSPMYIKSALTKMPELHMQKARLHISWEN